MSEATIEVDGLRKRFGATRALDGMSFRVLPGRVTGFVGPNGAGKSTTMRVTLGLDAADAGVALVVGRAYRSLRRPLGHVGSLLDASALQPGRTARNHLMWLAQSQGFGARRVDEVIGLAGLTGAARRKAGGYSLGSAGYRLPPARLSSVRRLGDCLTCSWTGCGMSAGRPDPRARQHGRGQDKGGGAGRRAASGGGRRRAA